MLPLLPLDWPRSADYYRRRSRRVLGLSWLSGAPVCNAPSASRTIRRRRILPGCGIRLGLTCAQCGTELPAGAKFCLECGQPVGTRPAHAVPIRHS